MEIRNKFPYNQRRCRAYREELEKLARRNPGMKFPGSERLNVGTTEREIKCGLVMEALIELFRTKFNRNYKIDSYPKAAVRVLMALNEIPMATTNALIGLAATSKRNISRILGDLRKLGLVRCLPDKSFRNYILTDEGRNFLK